MLKRSWLTVLVLVTVLALAFGITSVFAHNSDDGQASEEAWEAMHEACESGDWEAVAEAAEAVHGEDFGHMGGMMGGGMMDNW